MTSSDGNREDLITAEELSSYIDGVMNPFERKQLESRLSRNPEAAQRLSAFRRRDELLRRAYAAMEPSRHTHAPLTRSRHVVIALVILVLTIGGAGIWGVRAIAQHEALAVLDAEARLAHALYAQDAQEEASEGEATSRSSAQLSEMAGWHVESPDLSKLGFTLIASRVLKQKNGIAVVLVYRDLNGRAVSCYFERSPGAGETAYATSQTGAINAIYRVDDEIGYAVVGPFETQTLRAIADLGYEAVD